MYLVQSAPILKTAMEAVRHYQCWVVTTHLAVTFVWVEVSQVFGFPYAWTVETLENLMFK